MARFTNFNQILSQGNTVEDDDDDDDDDDTKDDEPSTDKDKDKGGWDEDDDDSDKTDKIQKVDVKAPAELINEYCDHNYWDIGAKAEDLDVDALIAELEA